MEAPRKNLVRVRKVHYATFNGVHNHIKAKALIVLGHRRAKLGTTTGLDCVELAGQAGVDLLYVRSKIAAWTNWKYINRKAGANAQGRPVYTYSIAARGVKFIEQRTPREVITALVKEIKEKRTSQP